jgi:hypothetical protein
MAPFFKATLMPLSGCWTARSTALDKNRTSVLYPSFPVLAPGFVLVSFRSYIHFRRLAPKVVLNLGFPTIASQTGKIPGPFMPALVLPLPGSLGTQDTHFYPTCSPTPTYNPCLFPKYH